MPSLKVLNQQGAEVGTQELSEAVFGKDYNESIIHQVIVAQANNKRQGTKSALTRAEVRGGGAKPWRQKGTGRARHGSSRSPQWTKGGVVFAPKPRDFSQKVNKQTKKAAIVSALSQKLAQSEIVLVDKVELAQTKTKEMHKVLENLKLSEKSVLFVLGADNDALKIAAANLPKVSTLPAELINVTDVVKHAVCLFTVDSIKKVEEAYND